jgi:hypothetical protein
MAATLTQSSALRLHDHTHSIKKWKNFETEGETLIA